MDVMDLRRRLMMQMVTRGAEFVTGSFTVPADYTGTFTLDYGKTFESYLLLIELTDTSKTALSSSGSSNASTFCYLGLYPAREVNNSIYSTSIFVLTYKPSTESFSNSSAGVSLLTGSSFSATVKDVSESASMRLLKGYSYNYTIISLDNI